MRHLAIKHLLVVGFVLFFIHPTDAYPALSSIPQPSDEVDAAADSGITNLIKLVQNDNTRAASIGFYSADEVTKDKVKRESGIPVLEIVGESVLDKPDFKNMFEYLNPLDQFMYPITVEGNARAVINVKKLKKAGKWKAVSFGGPGLASALEELKLLNSNGAFIARYFPLGIWLVCNGLDDKSACHNVTANPQALDYKTEHKVWPKRGPAKGESIGKVGTGPEPARAGSYVGPGTTEATGPGADAGVGRAETTRPRVEAEGGSAETATPGVVAGPGRTEAPGIRPEPGLSRIEAPDIRPETALGIVEAPPAPPSRIRVEPSDHARAEVEGSADKKEETSLVIIQKGENLRSLAEMASKRKSSYGR